MNKNGRWKNAMEGKSLMENVKKTKGMQSLFGKKSSVSKVDPCGVCDEGASCYSIRCMKCQRKVNHPCF